MSGGDKTKLGKILLKRKVVNSEDLEALLQDQKTHGGERLATQLLERGLSDEVKLLRALAEQFGVPGINLEEVEIELSMLDLIPKDIADQYIILPFAVGADSIKLAMANPDDQQVVEEIEFVTGKKIFAHVALHGQLVKFIEGCYGAKEKGEQLYRGKVAISRPDSDGSIEDTVGPAGAAAPSPTSGAVIPEGPSASSGDFGFDIEVDLPVDSLDPVEPPAVGAAAESPAEEASHKILVVDDEDDIRLLISRVLTEKGYRVVTASRGLEAIQKVQSENPDMLVLDAMLPEVHGFDICKKIKNSKKYGHIPVIMISAIYRGWRYAQDLKDSYGVDDFIEKPFKLNEFIKKIETHLERQGAAAGSPEDLSDEAERILARSVEAYRTGDLDGAITLLRKGLEIDPLAFKLHYNLALLLGKKNLYYQAIRELESALDLEPRYFPALKNLALLYQKAGFKFKSIETWERALQHCPDDDTRDSIKQHLVDML